MAQKQQLQETVAKQQQQLQLVVTQKDQEIETERRSRSETELQATSAVVNLQSQLGSERQKTAEVSKQVQALQEMLQRKTEEIETIRADSEAHKEAA